jgi:hypothetical protein
MLAGRRPEAGGITAFSDVGTDGTACLVARRLPV